MSTVASINLRDITANRPAAGIAGRQFYDTTLSQLQRDNGSSWDTLSLSGAITDHTHAATGTGANGGGATLAPTTITIPTSAPGSADGRVGWDATYHALFGYDTVQAKPVTPGGFAPFVMNPQANPTLAYTSSRALAAVSATLAGAILMPVFSPTPFFPYDITIISNDTATARTAEARLYVDALGNAHGLTYVPNTACTFSFTPSAASVRSSSTITSAGLLPAGWYYIALRNTSATQTFSIGTSAGSAALTFGNMGSLFLTTASIAALGSSFDITTVSGTASPSLIAACIRTLVAGGTTPYFA